MDACLSVEREVDKVLAKFSDLDRSTTNNLQEILSHLEGIREEIREGPESAPLNTAQTHILAQCVKKVADAANKLSLDHKDLHSSVSKVGKAIDRNLVSDYNSVVPERTLEGEGRIQGINNVICEHFLRQGMLDIAEDLIADSNLVVDELQKEPFLELHRILEALKQRELGPALRWAQINRERLHSQHSSLEFRLHRLQFIELVRQGPSRQAEALVYARNFEGFAASHAKELQVLMGTLLYLRQGLESSPYACLLDPIHWVEICDIFTRDACALLGLSVESPLSVVIKAGCTALPPLLNIKEVMQQRTGTEVWHAKDELPVEITLGRECQFHSIFACPILRQQSSDTNPPVRLVCGHVISTDALHKLTTGNKVKCPYCPVEQSPGDARQIIF